MEWIKTANVNVAPMKVNLKVRTFYRLYREKKVPIQENWIDRQIRGNTFIWNIAFLVDVFFCRLSETRNLDAIWKWENFITFIFFLFLVKVSFDFWTWINPLII